MFDENPYRAPVCNKTGRYDHSLLYRFLRACFWIALAFLALDLFSAALYLQSGNPVRWCSALSDCLSADAMRFFSSLGGAK